MRAIFHSPMAKADAQKPSGVSRMGHLFVRALEGAGVDVEVPNLPQSFDAAGNAELQFSMKEGAEVAAQRLLTEIESGEMQTPDFWFSYHVYHKSPDWIGPMVSSRLGIPYFVAEGSHAPKRAEGAWKSGYDGAKAALRKADVLLTMTAFDRVCLDQINPGNVQRMKPFIDVAPFRTVAAGARDRHALPRLLAVGMMRNERKLASFRMLACALERLTDRRVHLSIAGDGLYRREIETLFDGVGRLHEVQFLGAVAADAIPALMAGSDVFLWPGVGEAYGLVFLEAQAAGLPVVACRDRGVPDVVVEGETALLCAQGDDAAMSANLRRLLSEPELRQAFSNKARQFVMQERSVDAAALQLKALIAAFVH